MPFGNNGSEDFVLGQTTAFGSGVAKEYKKSTQKKRQRDLMNYMAEMGRQQQISNTSLPTTYDPNVVDEKEVRLVSIGRGQKPHPAVVSKQNDLNILKDMATFAAKDPKTFKNVFDLSMLQSPVKAVGAIGEATWARGNDNYQNDLSEQFFNSVNQGNIESWNKQKNMNDPTTGMGQSLGKVGTGSYDDKMKRIEAFMMNQEIIKSMKPDFTSDFTAGDAADTASWFIPGPGMLGKFAKTGVKTGAAVGKTVKDMRTALAAAKASGFAGDLVRGTKSGIQLAAGMPLGTAGGGSGLKLGKNAVSEAGRLKDTITRPIEQLRIDAERARDAQNWTEEARIEEEIIKQQKLVANDATLHQGNVTPDVRNVDRKDLLGYKLVDPTNGSWGASIRKMTRDDIAKSLKATLKNGFERQKGSGMQPDELPDFKSKDWEDAVDRFIAAADADNLVRTTGPNDEAVNWLSLANDHIEALKNPTKPGSNTIDNLIASYGRLNSQMGDKS